MKWLIILGLLALLLIVIATRFRRHIQMAIYVFKMFRKMRQMSKAEGSETQISSGNAQESDVALVRCAKCGSWRPQTEAIKFAGGLYYCSQNCVETRVT